MEEEEVIVAMLVGMGMPERVAEWTCEFMRERKRAGTVGVVRKVAKLISATPIAGCNTSAQKRWS